MAYLLKNFTMLALIFAVADHVQAQTPCRTAGWESDQFKGILTRAMDSDMVDFRARYSLPLVTPAQITFVSDSTVCARAGAAMDAFASTFDTTARPASTVPLYVFQVGTSFAVVDLLTPNKSDADFIYFFGPSWNFTGVSFMQ
ncbi:MAG: hypothetical protein ACR2NS_01265 [Gemmatimonadaceae bacterium]